MVRFTDPADIVKEALKTANGTIRQSELLESIALEELSARQHIDQLEIDGEIERFIVGNTIQLQQRTQPDIRESTD